MLDACMFMQYHGAVDEGLPALTAAEDDAHQEDMNRDTNDVMGQPLALELDASHPCCARRRYHQPYKCAREGYAWIQAWLLLGSVATLTR